MAKKRTAEPTRFSDQLRAAIAASGVSRYRIAKDTGIGQSALSRFMSGERGLSTETLDSLAAYLDLHVTNRPAVYSAVVGRTKQ